GPLGVVQHLRPLARLARLLLAAPVLLAGPRVEDLARVARSAVQPLRSGWPRRARAGVGRREQVQRVDLDAGALEQVGDVAKALRVAQPEHRGVEGDGPVLALPAEGGGGGNRR